MVNKQRRPELVAPQRRSRGRSLMRLHESSHFDELGRKDFVTGLILWVVLMIVSFVLLPGIGAINPGERISLWFALSLPLGFIGAFLMGASSRYMAITNDRAAGGSKSLRSILGLIGGWGGFACVLFPFIMAVTEFFSKLSLK